MPVKHIAEDEDGALQRRQTVQCHHERQRHALPQAVYASGVAVKSVIDASRIGSSQVGSEIDGSDNGFVYAGDGSSMGNERREVYASILRPVLVAIL